VEDRSVDSFLLTSQLHDRAIDLLPEMIQVHILGIGPRLWLRNEMGSSG